jgi:hypothetical protein
MTTAAPTCGKLYALWRVSCATCTYAVECKAATREKAMYELIRIGWGIMKQGTGRNASTWCCRVCHAKRARK